MLREADAQRILSAVLDTESRRISAFSVLEASLVVSSRKGAPGQAIFDSLLVTLALEVIPLDIDQVYAAHRAWQRFGKGHHPAALNIGDCCSYALAQVSGLPLLCKGKDFPRTDLPLLSY